VDKLFGALNSGSYRKRKVESHTNDGDEDDDDMVADTIGHVDEEDDVS
jgi:hypothetical protein